MKYRGIDAYTGKYVYGDKGDLFGEVTIETENGHVILREGTLEKWDGKTWQKENAKCGK